jgi:hypothetical protein
MTKVKMINSVGEHVAGEEYDLDDETSDRFILLDYATGDLSRDYSGEEVDAIQADHQQVNV